jgi:dolichol-phosphate mannosyltransferase
MNITLVIPTYNEKENISKMIDVLFLEYFPRINFAQIDLLVVDDNSPDGTADIVHNRMTKYNNLHLLTGEKKGLGHAYIKGFKYALDHLKPDAIIEMDADFQHNPIYLLRMINLFREGADYVICSRFIEGGSIPVSWEWYRKLLSNLGNRFGRLMLDLPDIHDITTGFRLTRTKGVLEKIELDNLMALDQFAYKVDLLYKTIKISKNIKEVPIHFAERKMEKSKFNLLETISTFNVIMRLWAERVLKK